MGELTGMLIAMGIVLTLGVAIIGFADQGAQVFSNQIVEFFRQAGIAGTTGAGAGGGAAGG